ncbi:MAG: class I SAM-dependent methyltransferase [Actinobacteria bacterium]|nr:class I SAM-dependent methyltransferase [Actinomycetota bacterium]
MRLKIHKGMSRNDLAKKFSDWGFKKGVEVGTQAGKFSKILCRRNKNLLLYTIDAFELVYGDNYTSKIGRRKQRNLYEQAVQRLLPYNCKVIKNTSIEVLKKFKFEELDFVYIDGSHYWDYITTDISMWGQKVRKGGIISGHDYYNPSFPDVVRAVNNYAEAHGVKVLNLTTDHTPSWWFERMW